MTHLAKANIAFLIIVSLSAITWIARPWFAERIWGDTYKDAMFQCDHVMREHLIAKTAVEVAPSDSTIRNLQAAELGLMHCHEYDKLRKQMIAWGLDQNDLSRIGLEALEEQEYELQTFVEIHEIRY